MVVQADSVIAPEQQIGAALANQVGVAQFNAVTDPILDIRGLSKTYKGGVKALNNVDLTIRRGEIFALLGPNGAGKTTLIGAICGLVRPTDGTIHAFGGDIRKNWRDARPPPDAAPRIAPVPPDVPPTGVDRTVRRTHKPADRPEDSGFSRRLRAESRDNSRPAHRPLHTFERLDPPPGGPVQVS